MTIFDTALLTSSVPYKLLTMTREPKGIGTRVNSWVVFLGLSTPKSRYIQLRSYASLPQGDEEKLLQLLLSSLQGPAEEFQ